jgi:hypothetical protein
MKRLVSLLAIVGCLILIAGGRAFAAADAEPELVIVKYGKLLVKSSVAGARVFIDDEYKGPADRIIENVVVGEHKIACVTEQMVTSGKFSVKKDEMLTLIANYDTGDLNVFVEPKPVEVAEVSKTESPKIEAPAATALVEKPEVKIPKAAAGKDKNKTEAVKQEKPKQQEKPKLEKPKQEKPKQEKPKKNEKKSPEEERRALHLNILKLSFDDLEAQEVHIAHKTNSAVISKYVEKKNQSGVYYRTKSNVLLCDKGPCEQQWSTSFVYTDETGKSDTFTLTWLQTTFNGITPRGTSKREVIYCVGGACSTLLDASSADEPVNVQSGRYAIHWTKSELVIMRSDIAKEITSAGGSLESY